MILLDYRDRRPLYEQVIDKFKELILQEILPPGEKLPSVRSLAAELSINPNTIQRAYVELERQGYIFSVKGKGSFVAEISTLKNEQKLEWKRRFSEVAEEGKKLGVTISEMEECLRELADSQIPAGKPDGTVTEDEPDRTAAEDESGKEPAKAEIEEGGNWV